MKQVLRKGLKEIVVEEVPDPVVIPHHVLVRPHYSLISSGTETASIHRESLLKEVSDNPSHLQKIWNATKVAGPVRTIGEVKAKFSEYAVLGYSGAGIVIEKDQTVTDLEIGDRVSYGGEGTGHGEVILAGRNLVARVPDTVSLQHASFTTLGTIALNAVRTASVELGEIVAVIGLGLVGQLICQLVRHQGAVVIGLDLKADRVALANKLGTDHALIGDESAIESIRSLTAGRGVDKVIVAAAAKSSAPCEQALRMCRDRGRIIVVGAVEMSFPWNDMYLKEIQLFMARAYGPGSYDVHYERGGQDYPLPYVRWTENRNMTEFLRMVSIGRVNLAPLITHEFPLVEASKAYETIISPGEHSLAVLLRYPSGEQGVIGKSVEYRRQTKIAVTKSVTSAGVLRVAVVGAGNLARWAHLPNLQKLRNVTLHAVCSTSGARGKTYASRFGAAYVCSDFNDILADPAIDVVLILTRNQHHAPQSLAALAAGKHVFVEKPMALTEDECRALDNAVKRSGKFLTVGFNRRFAPFYREQKALLARRVGPAVVNCLMNSPGISGSYWMADPSIGGAILGEACHFVDLMYWLLESEPVNVSTFSLPKDRKEPIGENNLAASFRFADGSIANLTYCTVGAGVGRERVDAFASGISVVCEDFRILKRSQGLRRRRTHWWPVKGYLEQLTDFISSVQAGHEPAVSVRDGARATLGCLKMLESAQESKSLVIDLDSVCVNQ